jgi:catechol 2,3-dioxygenase-like lactoylglutathione lyase family enzyme
MADARTGMNAAGMNHVGLTVGDIDAAVRWYTDVFGLRLLDGPMLCDTTTPGADRRREVFGEQWGAMKLAHMLTANSCGVELFQFIEPQAGPPEQNFEYWRFGPHHIAFTVDDFDAALRRICDHGGRARTKVYDVHGETFICYCEDPWGNVLEIVSRSYAELSTATTR